MIPKWWFYPMDQLTIALNNPRIFEVSGVAASFNGSPKVMAAEPARLNRKPSGSSRTKLLLSEGWHQHNQQTTSNNSKNNYKWSTTWATEATETPTNIVELQALGVILKGEASSTSLIFQQKEICQEPILNIYAWGPRINKLTCSCLLATSLPSTNYRLSPNMSTNEKNRKNNNQHRQRNPTNGSKLRIRAHKPLSIDPFPHPLPTPWGRQTRRETNVETDMNTSDLTTHGCPHGIAYLIILLQYLALPIKKEKHINILSSELVL